MKAAVVFQRGERPLYADFPDPVIQNENQLILTLSAAALKHIDKGIARGTHYSVKDETAKAKVIGGDGVGRLADGTRVFGFGETGMIAEKALVEKMKMIRLPDNLDDVIAAVLPNAIAGSAMALRFRAKMKAGETVLINGATGFTGKIAVQIAKHYGAGKIIVTGRNEESLQSLLSLGADKTISLKQDNETLNSQLKEIHKKSPIDLVIDYLWGQTAEILLDALQGRGAITPPLRYVSIGAITGEKIQLSAEILRGTNLQLNGSGLGSWTREEMKLLFTEIIPEMFNLAAEGKLKADIFTIPIQKIEKCWDMDLPPGKRLVITM